jgi:hypothetical protein
VRALSDDGRPRFAHVVLRLDLDPASRVDAPLDRAELGGELVVIGININFALFESLPQRPVVLRSSIDEPFLIDRCLAAVVGRDGEFELGPSQPWRSRKPCGGSPPLSRQRS